MQRWLAWIALSWLSAVAPLEAQATPLPLELEWSAPPDCPSGMEVHAELERIARVRAGHTLLPLAAGARVLRKGSGFHAVLRTEHAGRRGERTLEAEDCATLVRGLTLVLALAFGPGVELAAEGVSPALSASTPSSSSGSATPPPTAAAPSAPDPEPELEPSWLTISALASAAGSLNLFPGASFIAGAGLQLKLGDYALELRGLLSAPSSTALTPTIRAHFHAIGAALSACRLAALSANFELTACAGARFASLTARTTGRLERATATAPWSALAAGAAVSWPRRSWLQLRLELSAALSLTRPRFIVEALGDAHRAPLFIPELGSSLLVQF